MLKRFLLASLTLLLTAASSPDRDHTYSMLNGHGWTKLSPLARAAYLDGMKDALSTIAGRSQDTPCQSATEKLRRDYQVPFPGAEYAFEIEKFYADPQNQDIAVIDAVELYGAILRKVPQSAIDQRIRDHRTVAASDDHLHE